MQPTRQTDYEKQDDWADSALATIERMSPEQQRKLALHVLRVAQHCQSSQDAEHALRLCGDLVSTVELHRDERYLRAVKAAAPSGRVETVSVDEALAVLSATD